jgi:hypothetical protein
VRASAPAGIHPAPATLYGWQKGFTAAKVTSARRVECYDGLVAMSASEYDARDFLDKYVATLNKSSNGIVRDATELSHPKDIIKFVLQHCMKTIEDCDKQSFLRSAYLSLGNFQELSNAERDAVILLGEIGSPGSTGTDLHEEQTKCISGVAPALHAVMASSRRRLQS